MSDESKSQSKITRRKFLKSTSTVAIVGSLIKSFPFETTAASLITGQAITEPTLTRRISTWDFHRGSLGGPWEAWRKANDDANTWAKVQLPHCFNATDAVDPDLAYYQGPGWYRTRFNPQNPYANGRTLLHFEGVGQKTEVYVHTEKIASHVGGYDEFVVDITEAISKLPKPAKDPLSVPVAVMCDNSRDLEMIPSNLSDFNLYGGLYRYVNLNYVPAISIERVHIVSEPSEAAANVSVRLRLYNPAVLRDEVQISIEITDPQQRLTHSSMKKLPGWVAEQNVVTLTIDHPSLWSPMRPSLYRCVITLQSAHGEHRVVERFGVRSFEFVKNGPFKLNGERLLIRGTQRHDDHAGLAAAMTEELIRKEMRLIKDMGANFVRLGHYQQSRIVLDLCDELGLLVWEEIPWCRGGVGGERYKEQARRMLGNMINQHYNHPSVIIWGLGNENDWPGDFEEFDKEKIRAFMTELNQLSHSLDPSRKTAIRRCEFCKDIVDVYSPSIWMGWYGGRYTDYKTRSLDEIKKVDHFLHMEWGGDSHAGRHSEAVDQVLAKYVAGQSPDEKGVEFQLTGGVAKASSEGDWSETYICNLFDWHLKEQETMPELTGAAQWIFKDFSTPSRPNNPVPRVNQKGLVERDHTLKEGYFVFQSYWSDKPMLHIYGHSWPVRWGDKDEQKLVKVYSNCANVELFVNGKSAGVKKRSSQDFPAAGLRWLVSFKEGENVIRAVGNRDLVDEVKFTYQMSKWDKPTKLLLSWGVLEFGHTSGFMTVEVKAVDANGVQCLDARNVVRFGIAGDGKLIDNLGTSKSARKLELYNGRATINVELKGKAVVSVSSDGLPSSFITI